MLKTEERFEEKVLVLTSILSEYYENERAFDTHTLETEETAIARVYDGTHREYHFFLQILITCIYFLTLKVVWSILWRII